MTAHRPAAALRGSETSAEADVSERLDAAQSSGRTTTFARSTTSCGDALIRATMASTSAPVIGEMSIWVLAASARNFGSFIVAMKALRSAFLRAGGTAGADA